MIRQCAANRKCKRPAKPNGLMCKVHAAQASLHVRESKARRNKLIEDLQLWPSPADWPDGNRAAVKKRYGG